MLDAAALQTLLDSVAQGQVAPGDAFAKLKNLDHELVGDFARVDHHRRLRTGFPEVIWGQDKSPEQVIELMQVLSQGDQVVMATRITPEKAFRIQLKLKSAQYFPLANICALLPGSLLEPPASAPATSAQAVTNKAKGSKKSWAKGQTEKLASPAAPGNIAPPQLPPVQCPGTITIVTAGTADLPVAEEAALTAQLCGLAVERLWDVGVAGVHRLLSNRELLQRADVIIVVAGMEGALPSVVGGLVDCPVIAVPTSIGYGASFGGLSALLGMLNSCAAGLGVVNIDNGFGAAILAGQMLHMAARLGQAQTA